LFLHYKFRHLYNKILINLFSFLMLFLSFVNFGSSMFSVSRYLSLFYVISSLYAILLFSRINFKKMYWLTNLGLFPFVLHISLIVRFGIITIDTWLLTPIIVFYFSSPISIYELLF